MSTMLTTTTWFVTRVFNRACEHEISGAHNCLGPGSTGENVLESIDPTTLIVLTIVVLVILAICAYTLYFVCRDGYGPRPTRDNYNTRRPEP